MDVGFCEHPDHEKVDMNATNRIGDEWFCDRHLLAAVAPGLPEALDQIASRIEDLRSAIKDL